MFYYTQVKLIFFFGFLNLQCRLFNYFSQLFASIVAIITVERSNYNVLSYLRNFFVHKVIGS